MERCRLNNLMLILQPELYAADCGTHQIFKALLLTPSSHHCTPIPLFHAYSSYPDKLPSINLLLTYYNTFFKASVPLTRVSSAVNEIVFRTWSILSLVSVAIRSTSAEVKSVVGMGSRTNYKSSSESLGP